MREREVGDEIESKNKTRLCRDKQVMLRMLNLILEALMNGGLNEFQAAGCDRVIPEFCQRSLSFLQEE